MFLNPISFTAPLSFALPLSSLAQLSCAFCKKSMKHRPSKARKKEKKTEPGLLILLAGESATPIEVQTFPFLGVQRHHEDHTTVEPDIDCEMSSPSTKEAQILFAMSFFGRLGFCIQTWAGHGQLILQFYAVNCSFPTKMQSQSNIHTTTQKPTKTLKNTTKNIILHTTYHPVPSKTHPSFSLNPVNSTPSPTLHGFQVFRIYEAMIHTMKPNQEPPEDQHPTSHPLGVPFKGSLGKASATDQGSRFRLNLCGHWSCATEGP